VLAAQHRNCSADKNSVSNGTGSGQAWCPHQASAGAVSPWVAATSVFLKRQTGCPASEIIGIGQRHVMAYLVHYTVPVQIIGALFN
jgi:hypothetical protein